MNDVLTLTFVLSPAKRRNKWICALKQALAEVMVYGPTGDPNPPPAVTRYTQVPWDTVLYEDQKGAAEKGAEKDTGAPRSPLAGSWALRDKNAVIRMCISFLIARNGFRLPLIPCHGLSRPILGCLR